MAQTTLTKVLQPIGRDVQLSVSSDGTDYVRVQVRVDDHWSAAATFLLQGERLVLADLTLLPSTGRVTHYRAKAPQIGEWTRSLSDLPDPTDGIASRRLREIPITQLVNEAQRALGDLMPVLERDHRDHKRAARAVLDAPKRPGRAGRDDRYYAVIAARYAELCSEARVNERLGEEFDMRASQIRDAIYKARQRGLLTRQGQGRSGGRLTAKGLAVLKGTEVA